MDFYVQVKWPEEVKRFLASLNGPAAIASLSLDGLRVIFSEKDEYDLANTVRDLAEEIDGTDQWTWEGIPRPTPISEEKMPS